jgi:hypothetical protein
MAETILPNVRMNSDFRAAVRLLDSGVAVDWTTVTGLNVIMVSEAQDYAFAGGCKTAIDEDDATKLHIVWSGESQMYSGIHRLVVQVELAGALATYDKRVLNVIPLSDTAASVHDESDVDIEVSDVDTSIMTEILRACQAATLEANAAAAEAREATAGVEEAIDKAHTATEKANVAADVANAAAVRVDTSIAKAEKAAQEAAEATEAVKATDEAAKAAESTRKSSETAREEAETTRKSNEEGRVTAEDERSTAEGLRKDAEGGRASAESERATAEGLRANAEGLRQSAEKLRANAETSRNSAESARNEAEELRKTAEEERSSAEGLRKVAENARDTAEGLRKTAESERVSAETSRTDAETKRIAAETKRESDTAAAISKADTATSNATAATTAAQTATTEAKTATTDANNAAKAATEAKEAIEQDTAVVKTTAQELTDEQAAQARENIGAEFLHRALGKYNAIGERTLAIGASGKYIDVNGNEVSNSAYAISEPVSLNKGDDLLIPSASPVAAAVSVVSRKITNTYDEPIIYDLIYADDGKIATATAQYDKTLVYTAVYEEDTLTGWTMGGTSYDSLPATHSVTRSFYVPLVNQSVAAMPDTGYYVFPADEAMEVVISAFTATVNGGVCKVYGVGLIKNNATNMVGQTKQHVLAEVIADLYGRLESLEKMLSGEIGSLTVGRLTVRRAIEGTDIEGGKDLRGAGAPSASVLPEKWDAKTYGEWLGIPQFIGQTYDDTTNKIAYRAEGVTSVSDWRRITNA